MLAVRTKVVDSRLELAEPDDRATSGRKLRVRQRLNAAPNDLGVGPTKATPEPGQELRRLRVESGMDQLAHAACTQNALRIRHGEVAALASANGWGDGSAGRATLRSRGHLHEQRALSSRPVRRGASLSQSGAAGLNAERVLLHLLLITDGIPPGASSSVRQALFVYRRDGSSE